MRRHRSALCLIIMLLLAVKLTPAANITFGPYLDFKGFGPALGPVVIPTLLPVTVIPIPGDGVIPIFIRDRITINFVQTPIPIIALTYATLSVTGITVGPIIRLTDVWAMDLNPGGSAFAATGFNPTNPQIVPTSDENFIGLSGTTYPATNTPQTSTVAQLLSSLPGFDLSAIGGDPNSVIYVYQADVPLSDATVPEPTTAGILAFALMSLISVGRAAKWKLRG